MCDVVRQIELEKKGNIVCTKKMRLAEKAEKGNGSLFGESKADIYKWDCEEKKRCE